MKFTYNEPEPFQVQPTTDVLVTFIALNAPASGLLPFIRNSDKIFISVFNGTV